MTRSDGPQPDASSAPVETSPDGVATLPGLPPGRYTVAGRVSRLRVQHASGTCACAQGDNRQSVVLAIKKLEDSVVVASGRAGRCVGPRSRVRLGTDARADRCAVGRPGGDAPPTARDGGRRRRDSRRQLRGRAAAAEVADPIDSRLARCVCRRVPPAGGIFMDIITQPGLGSLRGGVQMRLRDGSMSGRSPFTPTEGPERTQDYSVLPRRCADPRAARFQSEFQRHHGVRDAQPERRAAHGHPIGGAGISARRASSSNMNAQPRLRVDQGPGAAHRVQPQHEPVRRTRASASTTGRNAPSPPRSRTYQLPHAGSRPARPAVLHEHAPLRRLERLGVDVGRRGADDPRQRRVHRGGQQVSGGRRTRSVNLASDLDYVRGIHSVRMGHRRRRRLAASDSLQQLPGHLHVRKPGGVRGGPRRAATRGASATRTSTTSTSRARCTSRTTSACGQGSRSAPACATRSRRTSATSTASVRGSASRGRRSATARTTLRASSGIFYDWLAPTRTSRRCASTDSASAR